MVIYNKLSNKANYGNYRDTSKIRWIVMHYTGNDGDTAKANANYFANNVVKASAHYFVDDISIYRSVPDDYVAWSVGGSRFSDWAQTGGAKYYGNCNNTNSISIEMCDTNRDGVIDVSAETLQNAVDLCKHLMAQYNVPLYRVICHFDVNGKRCPNFNNGAWILGDRPDFKKFKEMLEDDMTEDRVREIIREELVSSGSTPSSWASSIWERATRLGIVTPKKDSGDKLGERPKGYAKREEVVAMILKAMEDDGK